VGTVLAALERQSRPRAEATVLGDGPALAGPRGDRPERRDHPSENSWVCGFRCGSLIAPPVSGALNRNTLRPLVISDS
jgi:hypothetical protein